MGSLDNSPPERIPHEEYVGKDLTKARLLMPLKLSRLEQRVECIEKGLVNLSYNISEFILLLKSSLNPKLEEESCKPLTDGKYIS